MASKFPYRKKDDKALEEGEQIARARYRQDLRRMAQSLLEEHKQYPDQEISEMIDQGADNAVIYTRNALEILVESDNWTAIEDMGMEIPQDVTQAVTLIAYFAYRQDLEQYVEAYASEHGIETNPKRRRKRRSKKR